MRKIVLVAKGSYGDVLPLYAIADALQARGDSVVFALYPPHEALTRSLGYATVRLDDAPLESDTAGPPGSVWSALRGRFVARVLPSLAFASPSSADLHRECAQLRHAAHDADAIVGTQLAYSGPIVARQLGLPWIFCAVSPLALPSALDPPLFPYLHRWQRRSMHRAASQRPYAALARASSRLLLSSVTAARRAQGFAAGLHPQFEGMYSPHLNLMLTSPTLLAPAADWPARTVLTGFPWFERGFPSPPARMQRLAEFLDAGPPPVVFALGAGAGGRANPGRFFHDSAAAAARLGVRAVMVAPEKLHATLPASDDILLSGYLPYAALFPRARAVVHSGGIGTIGWSLRYGLPSLLTPSSVDQFDNAFRAEKRGLAEVLLRRRYTAPAVAARLHALLQGGPRPAQLQHLAAAVAAENGADVAADEIGKVLA